MIPTFRFSLTTFFLTLARRYGVLYALWFFLAWLATLCSCGLFFVPADGDAIGATIVLWVIVLAGGWFFRRYPQLLRRHPLPLPGRSRRKL